MQASDFKCGQVRYIKLGRSGVWAPNAIATGIIPFGYSKVEHEPCASGDWQTVRTQLLAAGRTEAGATQGIRELREFYELGDDTLWLTVADGHLWWAFAAGPVETTAAKSEGGPPRIRKTRDGWHRDSLTGEPLSVRNLSSALTRTANYRMTICAVDRADYAIRRIKGEDDPLHAEAAALKAQMQALALRMIRQLHWEEFETLVDLIFARGGWRRTSLLGKDMPDVDLVLDQPITGETAWVQIKSKAGQAELDDYLRRYEREGSCDRFFFVCHTPSAPLAPQSGERVHIWDGDRLAATAIDVGLFDWLRARTV